MKKLTLALLLITVVVSCKNPPLETYTLKVYFNNGVTDTLMIRNGYEIDDKGNLNSVGLLNFGTVAKDVKYVKELR